MFIGRNGEFELLSNRIESNDFELGILYGRRKIGKTCLLKEIISKYDSIYFVASQMSIEYNIGLLSNVIAEYYNEPVIFDDIVSIFKYLTNKSKTEKIILIIDEFTYLLSSNIGLLSVFQNIIDEILDNSNIKIILSGSHIGMIEESISYKKPLYGRSTFKIKLEAFDYYDSALFYPNASNHDKIVYYSIFGGIPFYLNRINDKKSIKQNVMDLIINDGAIFEDEISFFLAQEVRSINTYGMILNAVVSGATKLNMIMTKSKVNNTGTLIKYLDTLKQLGIVEKVVCFGEGNNSKKTMYKIKDQLFNFHYNFIEKNQSSKIIMESENFYDQYIEPNLDLFVSLEFERICSSFLKRKYKNTIQNIGNFWYNDRNLKQDIEIDIVLSEGGNTSIYECKWSNKKIDKTVLNVLKDKAKYLNVIDIGFFTKSGNTSELDGYIVYNVDDLYDKNLK